MRGGYTHNWNPYWNTSIYGAYAAVHYNDDGQEPDLRSWRRRRFVPTTFGAGVTSCNPDYNIAQLGSITRWTPVKNLTFSADFTYTHLDQKMAGTVSAPSARDWQAGGRVRAEGSGHRRSSCSALSATGNPVRLITI